MAPPPLPPGASGALKSKARAAQPGSEPEAKRQRLPSTMARRWTLLQTSQLETGASIVLQAPVPSHVKAFVRDQLTRAKTLDGAFRHTLVVEDIVETPSAQWTWTLATVPDWTAAGTVDSVAALVRTLAVAYDAQFKVYTSRKRTDAGELLKDTDMTSIMRELRHIARVTVAEVAFVNDQARRTWVQGTSRRTLYHPLCVEAIVQASKTKTGRVVNVAWDGTACKMESLAHLTRALVTACRSGAPVDGLDMLATMAVHDAPRRQRRMAPSDIEAWGNPLLKSMKSLVCMEARRLGSTPDEVHFVTVQVERARCTPSRCVIRHPLCVEAIVTASKSTVACVANVAWDGIVGRMQSMVHLARALVTAYRSGAP